MRLLRLLRFQRDSLARRAGGAAPGGAATGGDAARRRREAVGAAGELVAEAETRYVEGAAVQGRGTGKGRVRGGGHEGGEKGV